MKGHVYQERRRKRVLLIITICPLLGLLYPMVGREIDDVIAFIDGFTIGLIGGIFIAYFEYYFDNPFNRQIGFLRRVIFKILIYY